MEKIRTWEEIAAAFQRLDHLPSEPTKIRMVSQNHVFDETQSVKWNCEKVAENNAMYEAEMQRLAQQRSDSRSKVIDAVYRKIQFEVGHNLSLDRAMKIWQYALDASISFNHKFDSLPSEVDTYALLKLKDLIELVKLPLESSGDDAKGLNPPLAFEELQTMAKNQEPVWCDDGDGVSAGILCWRSDWSNVPERATNIWLPDAAGGCCIYLVMEFIANGAKFYKRKPEEGTTHDQEVH